MVAMACASMDPPLVLTEKQVQGLMDRSDISDQVPFTAYSRLGLQLISEDSP
jgi:hypothetical protein